MAEKEVRHYDDGAFSINFKQILHSDLMYFFLLHSFRLGYAAGAVVIKTFFVQFVLFQVLILTNNGIALYLSKL
jgi:hypothetical protein